MLLTMEKMPISLAESPNAHLLVLGRSGMGKTYFICRMMEEAVKKQKRILILDYSGSYSDQELKKNDFSIGLENVRSLNPEKGLQWHYRAEDAENVFADALIKTLGIGSYYQKKILKEVVRNLMKSQHKLTMPGLLTYLEKLFAGEEDDFVRQNLTHLLTRLEPYSTIDRLGIQDIRNRVVDRPVNIVQLSNYPESQRLFLTELLLELLWAEARSGKKRADVVVLDEFQNLTLKKDGAVAGILREGRKFGLSAWLSSQFIGDCSKQTVSTLMQAGNLLFFQPSERELRKVAAIIDPMQKSDWIELLGSLSVGEVIVKGNYVIGKNKKTYTIPIRCRVEQ